MPESDLPDGWVSQPIGNVAEINPRKPPKDYLPEDSEISFVPMKAVNADDGVISEPEVREFSKVRGSYTAFKNGDVIFAKITPCMENGKTAVARNLVNGIGFGSSEFHVLRPKDNLLAEYLHYFLRQNTFRGEAESQMTGSVGQKRVPTFFMKEHSIPVPPFPEQKQIVAKLDEIMAEIQAAKTHLARAKELIRRFRQSVLNAAVTGKLTEGITEEPSSTWCKATLGDLIVAIEAGKNIRCDEHPPGLGEVGIVKISAVTWGSFDSTASKTLTDPLLFREDRRIRSGDFLISRANTIELIGACVIVDAIDLDLMLSDKVLRLKFSDNVLQRWILFLLRSDLGRKQISSLASGNQLSMRNISQKNIRRIHVPLPSLYLQKAAVCIAESLLRLADVLDIHIDHAEQSSGKIGETILSRAFRGELVKIASAHDGSGLSCLASL